MSTPTLSSRTSAVTVFRRGAMVTRVATLRADADGFPRAVRVEGLPLLLDDSSVQVAVRRADDTDGYAAGPLPWAGDVRVTLAVPEPDPELRPPSDDELDQARLEVERAEARETDLEHIAAYLTRLVPGARGTPAEGERPMASPTEARMALLEFRRAQLEALNTRRGEAAETTRMAKERLATLEERERRASKARNPRQFEARKAVVIGLHTPPGPGATRVVLELSYRVPGARWAPSYVLRLDRSLGSGVLELRALVGQATGESWSDVDLSLSTALPQQWTELPELQSLRIGRRQPPPPKTGWRPSPPGADELFADYDRDLPPPKPGRNAAPKPMPRRARSEPVPQPESTGSFDLDALADAPGGPVFGSAGMPPPAPPAAAPAPVASAAPAAYAPGPPMGAAPSRGSKKRVSAQASFGGGGAPDALMASAYVSEPEPDAASVAATLVADRSQLQYGCLRVPAPDARRRGTLQRMSRNELYAHWGNLAATDVAAAMKRLDAAVQAAQTLERRSAPGSHHWAQGHDGFDHAYEAKARVDLPSDGVFVGIPLQRPEVEASPKYIAVPRETQDVFRVVAVRNPIEAPLLPGPVDVYVDGRFVLASELDLTPRRGRAELGLGVEQAIKIARNVSFDDESSGLLKRHRELQHRVRVELDNHLDIAATIEVRERLPTVPEEENDIEVSETTVEPAWDEYSPKDEDLEGGRVWKVEVAAGGRRELRATWSIRIPQSQELVGGNRREG